MQGYEIAGEPDVAIVLHREYIELNKRTKGAGLLHHLRRELRDVDLALDGAANAALVEQEAALLVGQADPARARARFRLFERASVGAELHDDETGFHVFRVGTMSRELHAPLACRRTRARSWTMRPDFTISARFRCRRVC